MSVDESQISLARSILFGILSRPDIDCPSIPGNDLASLNDILERVITGSDFELEISTCLTWILAHIATSHSRTSAFTKFLIKLAKSLVPARPQSRHGLTESSAASAQVHAPLPAWHGQGEDMAPTDGHQLLLPRLRILYLIDAWIRALSHHPLTTDASSICKSFALCLEELLPMVLPCRGKYAIDNFRICHSLMRAWTDGGLFDARQLTPLRRIVLDAYQEWCRWLQQDVPQSYVRLQKRAPALSSMPEAHGMVDAHWHEQPAGTILPLVIDNETIPISAIRPLRFPKASIDPMLADTVKSHIQDSDRLYAMPKRQADEDCDSDVVLNGLGLRVSKDTRDRKRKLLESYYGFSPGYLQNLKRQKPYHNARSSVQPAPIPTNPGNVHRHLPKGPFAALQTPPFPIPPGPPDSLPAFPFNIPPRPPGWQGPWPPPPPPHMNMNAPFPPPPPIPMPMPMPRADHGYTEQPYQRRQPQQQRRGGYR